MRPFRLHPKLLAACLLAWAVVGTLGLAVGTGHPLAFDEAGLRFWRRHAAAGLDSLALALTVVGNTLPMIGAGLLAVLLLLWRRQPRAAAVFALAVGGSMLLTQVIKFSMMRARPTLWPSLRPEHTYSFPSGHAMDTAALATAFLCLAWQQRGAGRGLAVGAALFSMAVGWARMYLGVHYPSDVLAGWASAVGWVTGVYLLAARPTQAGLPAAGAASSAGSGK